MLLSLLLFRYSFLFFQVFTKNSESDFPKKLENPISFILNSFARRLWRADATEKKVEWYEEIFNLIGLLASHPGNLKGIYLSKCLLTLQSPLLYIFNSDLDAYFSELFYWMFSESRICYYLTLLKQVIWNDSEPLVTDIKEDEEKAIDLLADSLPDTMSKEIKRQIAQDFVGLFKQKSINKQLIFVIFDLFLSKIFPEFENKKLIESLLTEKK